MCLMRKLNVYFNNLFTLGFIFFKFFFSTNVLRGCIVVLNGVEQWEARTPASAA